MIARIKAAWQANPWYKAIGIIAVLAAVGIAYYVFTRGQVQPNISIDKESWKKADSDPAKPVVENPISDKEADNEIDKINRELASRK